MNGGSHRGSGGFHKERISRGVFFATRRQCVWWLAGTGGWGEGIDRASWGWELMPIDSTESRWGRKEEKKQKEGIKQLKPWFKVS